MDIDNSKAVYYLLWEEWKRQTGETNPIDGGFMEWLEKTGVLKDKRPLHPLEEIEQRHGAK